MIATQTQSHTRPERLTNHPTTDHLYDLAGKCHVLESYGYRPLSATVAAGRGEIVLTLDDLRDFSRRFPLRVLRVAGSEWFHYRATWRGLELRACEKMTIPGGPNEVEVTL